jgi:poly-beta-hydroxyalkanoate depolymerase
MAESKGMRRMSPMMYQTYQNTMDMTGTMENRGRHGAVVSENAAVRFSDKVFGRRRSAELVSRSSLTYRRPDYDIKPVAVGNREWPVIEEVPFATPFGSLLHFKKEGAPEQPKVCSWRRCRVISRHCCAAPCRRYCRITTFTSPTGTTARHSARSRQIRPR